MKYDLMIREPELYFDSIHQELNNFLRDTFMASAFGNPLNVKKNTNWRPAIEVKQNDKNYKVKDAIIVHSIEAALEELKKYASEDVYVIGGDSIYAQMLPYCDTAHVTKIDFGYEADAWFPNLDENEEWKIAEESEEQTYFNLEYSFVKYVRK